MQAYQQDFIKFCLKNNVIRFGEFTLKSGRKSPYFFNSGIFHHGSQLQELGSCYAKVLKESNLAFDLLFGPAYKGIPLVCASVLSLLSLYGIDKPYCYNRKEAKDHGEKGEIVGASLCGRVCIIDDVITAGTAIRQSLRLIHNYDATVAGVVVLFDRQEQGPNGQSAIDEVVALINAPVYSVITLDDLITFIAEDEGTKHYLPAMQQYREQYGVPAR